jgi:hypothetical protein
MRNLCSIKKQNQLQVYFWGSIQMKLYMTGQEKGALLIQVTY